MIKLGGIERKLDMRDVELGAVQAPVVIPAQFKVDVANYPKYFQGQIPACGAHAGTFLKTVQEIEESKVTQNLSPRFLWAEIKKIDAHPPEDGTDMRSIFKTLQNFGVCDLSLMPNDVSLDLHLYTNPLITQEELDNAAPRGIEHYGFLTIISEQSIKQAIFQNKVVLFLIRCDDGFFRTDTPTFTTEKYGHFVAAVGYDEQYFYIVDSTEKDFFEKKIDIKYLNFIKEVGTSVDADDATIKELIRKRDILQKIVALYQRILELLKVKTNKS